jgi:hypothetical protein
MGADPPQGSTSQHGPYSMTTPTIGCGGPELKKALAFEPDSRPGAEPW